MSLMSLQDLKVVVSLFSPLVTLSITGDHSDCSIRA